MKNLPEWLKNIIEGIGVVALYYLAMLGLAIFFGIILALYGRL